MNISIRKQLTLLFIALMSAMFLGNFLVNTIFLERFYYMRKQQVLADGYEMMSEFLEDGGTLSIEEQHEYLDYCNKNGILFLITDRYYNKIWWTESEYINITLARLNGYGIGIDIGTVLEQNEQYTIQKKYDSEIELNYLEMWGLLTPGYYFIMRINIEGIQESVRIANEFLTYILLIALFMTGLFVWIISNRVTQPLCELTELSKRMAELDFDAKYTSGGNNEVGQLGAHFNQMSENLEKTYSQLLTANNELQKDLERKEKVDDMRKEFLSNVSHELKTPIALIQGYAEGLQECINDDPESRAFYCEVIIDEAAKMNGLVQKLLTLNQLEFGNDQVVMERFDMAELIRNKLQSVSILAQQKEVQVQYFGSDSLPVWGDEYKVEEVLTNYISNALNHVDGARRITVTAQQRDPDHVRIRVFNTGSPIPESDLTRIWDKFYKVDKARTREYGGSGVGLSIVKAIMESFHQEYGVTNREDGVEFWFELQSGQGDAKDRDCSVIQ